MSTSTTQVINRGECWHSPSLRTGWKEDPRERSHVREAGTEHQSASLERAPSQISRAASSRGGHARSLRRGVVETLLNGSSVGHVASCQSQLVSCSSTRVEDVRALLCPAAAHGPSFTRRLVPKAPAWDGGLPPRLYCRRRRAEKWL